MHRIKLSECEGKTIKAVASQPFSANLAIAFTDNTFVYLEAEEEDYGDRICLRDDAGFDPFYKLSQDDRNRLFDAETLAWFCKHRDAKEDELRKRIEAQERETYFRLKAKYEH